MIHFKYLPLFMLSVFSHANESATLDSLSNLRWENRLIIMNEPVNSEAALSIIKSHTAEIDDRDIIWFILKEGKVLSNYTGTLSRSFISTTQQEYQLDKSTVTLIGKDGGIKSQHNQIDVETLFSTIDAMPMRQREMQQK